jgi:regulator of protease activity HflC (stomatin/prohibitin superfamily)
LSYGDSEGRRTKEGTCETKDFVEIGLKADVFYRIADPEKVLLIVGKVRIQSYITLMMMMTI